MTKITMIKFKYFNLTNIFQYFLSFENIKTETNQLQIRELVEVINDIDVLFKSINKTFGMLVLITISNDFFGGFVTMFMLARKVASGADLFLEDDSTFLYVVCILYIQLKIIMISYFSHKAYEKVISRVVLK